MILQVTAAARMTDNEILDFFQQYGWWNKRKELQRLYKEKFGSKLVSLGYGSMAAAYAHPYNKKRVIRVAAIDRCWRKYVLEIAKTIKSKHIPKVFAHKLGDFHDMISDVFITERLYRWDDKRLKAAVKKDPVTVAYMLRWSARFHIDFIKESKAAGLPETNDEMNAYYKKLMVKHGYVGIKLLPIHDLIEKLRKVCTLDLNKNNIMFRRNGEVVLNDPIV